VVEDIRRGICEQYFACTEVSIVLDDLCGEHSVQALRRREDNMRDTTEYKHQGPIRIHQRTSDRCRLCLVETSQV
jgi:hypothetical protein